MPHLNDEATPIARLIGPDGKSIVGLVYVWETSELAILWLNPRKTATFVDPKIGSKMLEKAKSTTPEELFALVGRLQTLAK
ncbi:hypothetical protein EOK75_18510 (plasmid) [Pseudorhodobacter turbinis]|uniref:Uncharacterized protein n=1 Tax=Pseudorhodobacter turbinis TaxID=2500533 RepID=A0A4V1E1C8_9RHOB|nr:hypothetical protein [Pseudorhodobacter turbinis]QCO57684.1 hypothetical protein EOK75_18510 [Pseudorhodobacter turbinis]